MNAKRYPSLRQSLCKELSSTNGYNLRQSKKEAVYEAPNASEDIIRREEDSFGYREGYPDGNGDKSQRHEEEYLNEFTCHRP